MIIPPKPTLSQLFPSTTQTTNKIVIPTPKLHEGQKMIMEGRRRFNVLMCGRRFGKTTLIRSKYLVLECAFKRMKIGLFAPEFKSVSETWDIVEKAIEPLILHNDKNKKRLTLKNGSIIEFWSLLNKSKKDSARGRDYDRVIYEETQSIPHDVLKYHWEKVARATLSDRIGDGWFIGTPPNSKKHYFYKLVVRGAKNNPHLHNAPDLELPKRSSKDWMSFRATGYDNPHILNSEIDAAADDLTERVFLQEYKAICIEYADDAWFYALDSDNTKKKVFKRNLKINWKLPLFLSFDFNKNPMSAILSQKDPNPLKSRRWATYLREFGAKEGQKVNIHHTCQLIKNFIYKETGEKIGKWDGVKGGYKKTTPFQIFVTGDATGNTTDGRQVKGQTYFEIICEELGLNPRHSLHLRKSNPLHTASSLQVNTWLEKGNVLIDEGGCPRLKQDLILTQATQDNKINKKVYDPHFGDAFRYDIFTFMPQKPPR